MSSSSFKIEKSLKNSNCKSNLLINQNASVIDKLNFSVSSENNNSKENLNSSFKVAKFSNVDCSKIHNNSKKLLVAFKEKKQIKISISDKKLINIDVKQKELNKTFNGYNCNKIHPILRKEKQISKLPSIFLDNKNTLNKSIINKKDTKYKEEDHVLVNSSNFTIPSNIKKQNFWIDLKTSTNSLSFIKESKPLNNVNDKFKNNKIIREHECTLHKTNVKDKIVINKLSIMEETKFSINKQKQTHQIQKEIKIEILKEKGIFNFNGINSYNEHQEAIKNLSTKPDSNNNSFINYTLLDNSKINILLDNSIQENLKDKIESIEEFHFQQLKLIHKPKHCLLIEYNENEEA